MIVVLGSINADLLFRVERLPERGETVLGRSWEIHPGGKGANQAVGAARCGSEVLMVGCVGSDPFSDTALQMMREAGVNLKHVARTDTGTGLASIMVESSGENQIVVASGANLEVRADQVPPGILGPGATILLQMEIPVSQVKAMTFRARQSGSRVILNLAPAKPLPDDILRMCDVLVVNELEAQLLAGSGDTPEALAVRLAQSHELDCIVTLGGAGSVLAASDSCLRIPALEINAVDTVGAGDAFAGALASTLDEGADISDAVRFASVAGGLTCLKSGAQAGLPTGSEIRAALPRLKASTVLS